MKEVDYKDLQSLVGQEIGVSDWVEITQERVNTFADATGDPAAGKAICGIQELRSLCGSFSFLFGILLVHDLFFSGAYFFLFAQHGRLLSLLMRQFHELFSHGFALFQRFSFGLFAQAYAWHFVYEIQG